MNPCPCGYLGDPKHACRCTYPQIQRYRAKISGPLLDRIDIHVEVPAVPCTRPAAGRAGGAFGGHPRARRPAPAPSSRRASRARKIFCNAQMSQPPACAPTAASDDDSRRLLESAIEKLGLSARAYNRVLKIARTIADLAGAADIGANHISEAIQYRTLDRGRSA